MLAMVAGELHKLVKYPAFLGAAGQVIALDDGLYDLTSSWPTDPLRHCVPPVP